MALKLVALGWRTYFTNGFNLLDFFCVLISWLTLLPGDASTLGALKSLRTLRGLRPLRLIKRVKAMQTVIEALVRALPAIGNVLLMLLIFWLVRARSPSPTPSWCACGTPVSAPRRLSGFCGRRV